LPSIGLNNLPTSGVVALDFDTKKWSELAEVSAKLGFYDYPKNPELLLIDD
jgi:hypothetical protein